MHRLHRIATFTIACAGLAVLLVLPATGQAAEPPSLTSPAANADPSTEGGSMTYTWKGERQGDATALDRSFFRVEMIPADKMPTGTQSAWPESDLENFVQTEPGQDIFTATMGVPVPGDYRWRVCVWGVVDVLDDNVIQQLPGGCSASRPFTSVAAQTKVKVIGSLPMKTKTRVEGRTTTVFVPRNDTTTTEQPTPQQPAPVVEPTPEAPLPPATFQQLVGLSDALGKDGSSLALGDHELAADSSGDGRGGVAGAIMGGLGSNLPFVPIPFWTLLLLLLMLPVLVFWRRDVLEMFEWSDGSIDGAGTMPDPLGELAIVPLANDFKDRSIIADGEASAPPPALSTDAPDGRRRAA